MSAFSSAAIARSWMAILRKVSRLEMSVASRAMSSQSSALISSFSSSAWRSFMKISSMPCAVNIRLITQTRGNSISSNRWNVLSGRAFVARCRGLCYAASINIQTGLETRSGYDRSAVRFPFRGTPRSLKHGRLRPDFRSPGRQKIELVPSALHLLRCIRPNGNSYR